MRTIRPFNNQVLVQPVELPEKSAGGILLPEQARERSGEATVIAVGPGKLDGQGRMIAPPVKPGDKVMYSWIDGRDVKVNGHTLKLVDADLLLGGLD